MCGGDIQAAEGTTYGTCDSCATVSTLPAATDERIINLFNRANLQRQRNEFDKALANYENILNEGGANAEAHWCVVLCRYGIDYVEDPRSHERIPTCYRVQYEPVLQDADYLAALDNAPDSYTRELYQQEAKKISEIQKGILAISQNEEPYDVFICYKETTDGGTRTKDSALAQDIYYQLVKDGHKVFFSRITLEGKLGREYEPYIFAALNSAKVMLVIGTKPEHFNAVWVANEWSRFLSLIKKESSRLIIPCYRDMDAYDIPDKLAVYQSQDMSRIGFMQDLLHGVKKVFVADKKPEVAVPVSGTAGFGAFVTIDSLMKRAHIFLEDGDTKQADEYFNKALDIDPENARAYAGKLLIDLSLRKEEDLENCDKDFSDNPNYKKVIRYADENCKSKFIDYSKNSLLRSAMENMWHISHFGEAKALLSKIIGFKNADELLDSIEDKMLESVQDALKSRSLSKIHDSLVYLGKQGTFTKAEEYREQLRNEERILPLLNEAKTCSDKITTYPLALNALKQIKWHGDADKITDDIRTGIRNYYEKAMDTQDFERIQDTIGYLAPLGDFGNASGYTKDLRTKLAYMLLVEKKRKMANLILGFVFMVAVIIISAVVIGLLAN